MNRTNLLLLSSMALVAAGALNACGSKDSMSHVVRPTVFAKMSGDRTGNLNIKDQSGAVSVSGEGVFAQNSSGMHDLNSNLVTDDKGIKMNETVSVEVEADIKTAQAAQTFLNLGCRGQDGKPGVPAEMQKVTKDLKEITVTPQKDLTIYSASVILICGKVILPTRMKMASVQLYFRDANVVSKIETGKWIVSAQSVFSRGSENKISLPIKSEGDSALDLSIVSAIAGATDKDGNQMNGGTALQIQVAKKSSVRHSKPKSNPRNGLTDGGSVEAESGSEVLNDDLNKDQNAIEEENGQQNENNI